MKKMTLLAILVISLVIGNFAVSADTGCMGSDAKLQSMKMAVYKFDNLDDELLHKVVSALKENRAVTNAKPNNGYLEITYDAAKTTEKDILINIHKADPKADIYKMGQEVKASQASKCGKCPNRKTCAKAAAKPVNATDSKSKTLEKTE